MYNERQVSLFRNGRNQAIIRKEGDKLIVEPVKPKSLKEVLAVLPELDENFPEISDPAIEPEDIF